MQNKQIKKLYGVPLTFSPSAADTIYRHFSESDLKLSDYDYIITGDLAMVGSDILYELLDKKGINISEKHLDCGSLIFDREAQRVDSGGSGCGCVASVFCSYFLTMLKQQKLNRILLIATGALMSPSSVLVGETISGIAHAVTIERV